MSNEDDNVIYPKEFSGKKGVLIVRIHTPLGVKESEATLSDVYTLLGDRLDFEVHKLEKRIEKEGMDRLTKILVHFNFFITALGFSYFFARFMMEIFK